ncbi:hypothetical protein DFP73DRAFT_583253 [Morchella snyderi]|nr:hypothetical protein DFP73DRAFT_583253 [Morchella snyderi]
MLSSVWQLVEPVYASEQMEFGGVWQLGRNVVDKAQEPSLISKSIWAQRGPSKLKHYERLSSLKHIIIAIIIAITIIAIANTAITKAVVVAAVHRTITFTAGDRGVEIHIEDKKTKVPRSMKSGKRCREGCDRELLQYRFACCGESCCQHARVQEGFNYHETDNSPAPSRALEVSGDKKIKIPRSCDKNAVSMRDSKRCREEREKNRADPIYEENDNYPALVPR